MEQVQISRKMKILNNKIMRITALLGAVAFASGCAFDLLPYSAQPGFHRDLKEKWRKEEQRVEEWKERKRKARKSDYTSGYARHGRLPGKCATWLTNNPDDTRLRPKNTRLIGNPNKPLYFPAKGYVWEDSEDPNNPCTIKIER